MSLPTPLSDCIPRDIRLSLLDNSSFSIVSLDINTLPGTAIDSILLATFTTSPKTSSLSIITLPVWIPALTFKPESVLAWNILAHSIALSTLK